MSMRSPLLLSLLGVAGCAQDYDVTAQKRVLSTQQATFDAGMVAVGDREILDGLFREDLRSAQVDGARADLERSSWVASGAELDRVWTSWVG